MPGLKLDYLEKFVTLPARRVAPLAPVVPLSRVDPERAESQAREAKAAERRAGKARQAAQAREKYEQRRMKADKPVPRRKKVVDPYSFEQIMALVCEASGLPEFKLLGDSRGRKESAYRSIAYWLLRRFTSHTWQGIGYLFHNRDHSTILINAGRVGDVIEKFRLRPSEDAPFAWLEVLEPAFVPKSRANAGGNAPGRKHKLWTAPEVKMLRLMIEAGERPCVIRRRINARFHGGENVRTGNSIRNIRTRLGLEHEHSGWRVSPQLLRRAGQGAHA